MKPKPKPGRLTRMERKQTGAAHLRVTKATHALVMDLLKAEGERKRPNDPGWWYRYSRYDLTVDDVLYELVADRLEALARPAAPAAVDVNTASTSTPVNKKGSATVNTDVDVNGTIGPLTAVAAAAEVNESAIGDSLTKKRRKSPIKPAMGWGSR